MNWFGIYFTFGCVVTVIGDFGALWRLSKEHKISFREVMKSQCISWLPHREMIYWAGFFAGTLLMGLIWPIEVILECIHSRFVYKDIDYRTNHILQDKDS